MLGNTWYKLKNEKKLRIAYFGGSITEGAGASNSSVTSYRARTTAWFKDNFPDAEITPIMAAIGGTGSKLGMYRCDTDVLAKNPDLLIMEFAVNDSGEAYEDICEQSETILQKVFAHNPYMDVIVITTMTQSQSEQLEEGIEFVSRTAHMAIAHHYKLPILDVGTVQQCTVLRSGGDFMEFTKDSVHPNDKGYDIYTRIITGHLEKWLASDTGDSYAKKEMPAKLFCDKLYMNAKITDCSMLDSLENNGFTLQNTSLCDRYPRYMEAKNPGDSLSFTFTGVTAGLYWMMAKDGGDVLISVDGGEEILMRCWDKYCLDFNRIHPNFFVANLEYGVHRVTLRIADSKAEKSEGTAVRIGGILIS